MTIKEFEYFCKNNTPEDAARLLRKWVKDGQPYGFLENLTSRSMCSLTSECYSGRFGGNWDYMDFYQYMWSGDALGTQEERKERHIRCNFKLDEEQN